MDVRSQTVGILKRRANIYMYTITLLYKSAFCNKVANVSFKNQTQTFSSVAQTFLLNSALVVFGMGALKTSVALI